MTLYQIQNQAQPVIADKASYTFSDYFKLNAYIEDIVAYFWYEFQARRYSLPQKTIELKRVQKLAQRLDEWLPNVYGVPGDLEELLKILVAILKGEK